MSDLSRKYATWEREEDRRLLEWNGSGLSIHTIANELRRSPNAIRMRLEYIKPPTYTPTYTPIYTPIYTYTAPQIQDTPIENQKTQAELDGEYILSMRANGMSDDYIKKMMFTKASMPTHKKNDSCFIA